LKEIPSAKLIVAQLFKKFPDFYETGKIIGGAEGGKTGLYRFSGSSGDFNAFSSIRMCAHVLFF
jgi:hypothetical protein